jgi:hypothetical protein
MAFGSAPALSSPAHVLVSASIYLDSGCEAWLACALPRQLAAEKGPARPPAAPQVDDGTHPASTRRRHVGWARRPPTDPMKEPLFYVLAFL